MEIEKLQEIVVELSARLADDSDYESNLKPKCQALLDHLNEDPAEQLGKEIYSGQHLAKKGDMIVCYTTGYNFKNSEQITDNIEAFREDTKSAFARYNELVYKTAFSNIGGQEVLSASICQVIDSTDYDGMWDSEVGEDNLVDPNMKKYIDHQIEIITDSDWFEELVKDKVKEVSDENN